MSPASTIFINGLSTANQFLTLLLAEVQCICCCLVNIAGPYPLWMCSQKAENRLYELVVGRHGHCDFHLDSLFETKSNGYHSVMYRVRYDDRTGRVTLWQLHP